MFDQFTWTLAQTDGAAPPPTAPGGADTGTTGATTLQPTPDGQPLQPNQQKQQTPGGGWQMLVIIVGAMFLLIVLPMFTKRKEEKKRTSMLNAIRKGDRVQTVGGIIGSVVDVDEGEIVLKVDENSNTRMTFARAAVQTVLTSKSKENES